MSVFPSPWMMVAPWELMLWRASDEDVGRVCSSSGLLGTAPRTAALISLPPCRSRFGCSAGSSAVLLIGFAR